MSETISFETLSTEVNVPRHIIHLWTKKFPLLSPQRTQDGKVGFKNRDLALAKGLKHLLIDNNQSIIDVQTLLNERGIAHVIDMGKNAYLHTDSNPLKPLNNVSTFPKSTPTTKFDHKHIAKQAFSNLSSIFSKEKQRTPFEKTPLTAEAMMLSLSDVPDISHDTPAIMLEPEEAIEQISPEDSLPDNFEDNWRTLMEKTGKATPIEDVRDKPNLVDDHLLSDIWEIDDEIDLFDDEPLSHTPAILSVAIQKPHLKTTSNTYPIPIVNSASKELAPQELAPQELTPKGLTPKGLTIEQSEKIKHLIAKLDIMRDEMASANAVITKTLKAFGYSGFENAYNKFDQKSVY
jgi:DNA-binding transcriptional MerR regulator